MWRDAVQLQGFNVTGVRRATRDVSHRPSWSARYNFTLS